MIQLEISKYYLLKKPLKEVSINSLFARAVIEKKVKGEIYADNEIAPTTFYVVHPYGMTLLFGNFENDEFNKQFVDYALNVNNERNSYEWMQASPRAWDVVLKKLFKEHLVKSENNSNGSRKSKIELHTRVNFKFKIDKYLIFKKEHIIDKLVIKRTDKNCFKKMKGSVIPSNFWNSANDFYKNGVGFSLFHGEKLACTAYSAFIFDNKLELGMETIPEFRGKGFAQYACSALINYCIENNYEPIWACRFENKPSYNLAKKLGFEPTIYLPYYRLSN